MNTHVLFGAAFALACAQISFADNGFYAGLKKRGGEAVNSKLESGTVKVEGMGASGSIYGTYLGYIVGGDGVSFALGAEYTEHNSEAKYKIDSLEEKHRRAGKYSLNAVMSLQVHADLNFFVLAGVSKARFEGKTNTGLKGDDKVRGTPFGLGLELKNEPPV